jgi:hypothetical protein
MFRFPVRRSLDRNQQNVAAWRGFEEHRILAVNGDSTGQFAWCETKTWCHRVRRRAQSRIVVRRRPHRSGGSMAKRSAFRPRPVFDCGWMASSDSLRFRLGYLSSTVEDRELENVRTRTVAGAKSAGTRSGRTPCAEKRPITAMWRVDPVESCAS